jgi:hypothetical protein
MSRSRRGRRRRGGRGRGEDSRSNSTESSAPIGNQSTGEESLHTAVDRGSERQAEPQRSFDLPPVNTEREEAPRPAQQTENRSAEPAAKSPEPSPYHSNQSFHFEPSKPNDSNKTYTVWSSNPGSARRDE